MGLFSGKPTEVPSKENALAGRVDTMQVPVTHFVNGRPIADIPSGYESVLFGMGCFWGAERVFWQTNGVWVTSVGYAAGHTPNATYEEVCSGQTGHNEVVRVVFNPQEISFEQLLKIFWEGHDPTQGMRQGNDMGTQYRSGIYVANKSQKTAAEQSRTVFATQLQKTGLGEITTEILDMPKFYYAEEYHQQYLAKNPGGYCGIGGTGVTCPIGVVA